MLLHSLAAVLLGAAGRAELFLEADVAALSERARHALRRHWEGNPRARKPRAAAPRRRARRGAAPGRPLGGAEPRARRRRQALTAVLSLP